MVVGGGVGCSKNTPLFLPGLGREEVNRKLICYISSAWETMYTAVKNLAIPQDFEKRLEIIA